MLLKTTEDLIHDLIRFANQPDIVHGGKSKLRSISNEVAYEVAESTLSAAVEALEGVSSLLGVQDPPNHPVRQLCRSLAKRARDLLRTCSSAVQLTREYEPFWNVFETRLTELVEGFEESASAPR